jgi:uncharacterized delta-60 repeat protein
MVAALALALVTSAAAAPGDPDRGFGREGTVTTDFGRISVANAVTLQPDGDVVVAGRAGDGRTGDFAIARYRPDGTPDAGFGTGGAVTTRFTALEDVARAVAALPDGKLVVAGLAGSEATGDFALARYEPDGTLDRSFGVGGKVTTDLSGGLADGIRGMAILPGGRILAAGPAGAFVGLARYEPDGSLDRSFGAGGKEVVRLAGAPAHVFALAPLADGRFLVAGSVLDGVRQEFVLARFRADGALDPDFGTRGVTATRFTALNDLAFALAVQPDGKIVVAGNSNSLDQLGVVGQTRFAVARYTPDGRLDPSFGENGRVQIDPSGAADGVRGIALEPDGKIVVGGFIGEAHGLQSLLDPVIGDFGLARLNPDGSLDATFGTGGVERTDFAGGGDGARAVATAASGKVVLAGGATRRRLDFALAEYDTR